MIKFKKKTNQEKEYEYGNRKNKDKKQIKKINAINDNG